MLLGDENTFPLPKFKEETNNVRKRISGLAPSAKFRTLNLCFTRVPNVSSSSSLFIRLSGMGNFLNCKIHCRWSIKYQLHCINNHGHGQGGEAPGNQSALYFGAMDSNNSALQIRHSDQVWVFWFLKSTCGEISYN